MVKISDSGFWIGTKLPHGVDEKLADALVKFFDENNFYDRRFSVQVIDVGCGNGFYTNYITNNSKYCTCIGYDGNPNTPELGGSLCFVADFSVPQDLGIADWVLSLEVGEHIPEKFEQVFLDNLANSCLAGIVLSWATPGQGGDGHVNCRSNEYIISEMEKRGFIFDKESAEDLRYSCSPYPKVGYWFFDTIMVFRKGKK